MTVMHTEPCPTNDGGRGTCVCFPTDTPLYQMQRLGKDDTMTPVQPEEEEARREAYELGKRIAIEAIEKAFAVAQEAAAKPPESVNVEVVECPYKCGFRATRRDGFTEDFDCPVCGESMGIKPPEPLSPWPLYLAGRKHLRPLDDSIQDAEDPYPEGGYLLHDENLDVDELVDPSTIVGLRNALVADASTAEKDALLVALCEERGIDLEYAMRSCMPEALYEDEGYLTDERDEVLLQSIRAVLGNAKGVY